MLLFLPSLAQDNDIISSAHCQHNERILQTGRMGAQRKANSLRPAFNCGNGEESEHAVEHVVKVEVAVEPLPLGQHRVLKRILHVL